MLCALCSLRASRVVFRVSPLGIVLCVVFVVLPFSKGDKSMEHGAAGVGPKITMSRHIRTFVKTAEHAACCDAPHCKIRHTQSLHGPQSLSLQHGRA